MRRPPPRAAPGDATAPGPAPDEPPAAAAGEPPLATALGVLSAVCAAKALAGAIAPAALLAAILGQGAVNPASTALMGVVASASWLVAAWLQALKDAALHDRLASGTYKRLALGLLYVAAGMAVTNLRFAPTLGPLLVCGSLGALGVACALGAHLWSLGSGGASVLGAQRDILKAAAADVAACVSKPAGVFGAYYALQALSCLALFLWLFPTNATPLFPDGLTAAGSYLTRCSAAGLALVGVTAFTLKDAADRGRLGASTFKLLNLALAATIAQQVWFFYTLGGAGVALNDGMWRGIIAQGVVGVLVCDVAFLTAKKK
ncbi:hypothetical protein Rsub_00111 [Raphidocelis subcapitata]|uniref:Uncharacterized protein n=1 Tax=Raphidocelis subcapitata TaxID=307507 RepID=A0A2V0NPH4_9CHLO|nr:hypothetical protein Rsub_00111 [Raphidocelis subcapitata]|eukprot:GBF87400.1 hypothetical protein Rsub_00111 [Raphidocelis subcapitata]